MVVTAGATTLRDRAGPSQGPTRGPTAPGRPGRGREAGLGSHRLLETVMEGREQAREGYRPPYPHLPSAQLARLPSGVS